MKNVTLSMPEDLLKRSREYAKKHGTTLNQLIRDLLKITVRDSSEDFANLIRNHSDKIGFQTKNYKFNREDLYDRKILS